MSVETLVREMFRNEVDWPRFDDIYRSLNWELWHGPLPENYWIEVEPLEHYKWSGFEQAQNDLIETLEPLPAQLYLDTDSLCVTTTDPYEDPYNWSDHPDHNDGDEDELEETEGYRDAVFIGGDGWTVISARQTIMNGETFRQVFG
jgi:hypothetical protein